MGNHCWRRNASSKLANEVEPRNLHKNFEPDLRKVIKIQNFFRNIRYRKEIKNKIIFHQKERKRAIKEQYFEFRESWDSYFKKVNTPPFTMEELTKLQNDAKDFYLYLLSNSNKFTRERNENLDSLIDNLSEKIKINNRRIILNDKKLLKINENNFMNELRIPILKFMSDSYSFGDFNLELNKICFEIQNIQFIQENLIEEKKTLENAEEYECEKSVFNINFLKKEKGSMDNLEKQCEIDPDSINFKKFDTHAFSKNLDYDWCKKDTYKSEFSKTNCKSTSANNTVITNENRHLKKDLKPFLIRYIFDSSKSIILIREKSFFFEYSIQYININNKECKYVSFLDERNTFYKGSWHMKRICKFGIGYEYKLASNNNNSSEKKSKYYGMFLNGLYNGLGMMVNEDGEMYFGEFREGRKNGWGKHFINDIEYQGFFKNNLYHGYGELKLKGKVIYMGTFVNGFRSGIGFCKYSDGSFYIGGMVDDNMNGVGLFRWKQGDLYYGSMKEGKMNGVGKHLHSDGGYHIGIYLNDKKHGPGEYHFKNGSVLTGVWKNSKKEGVFKLIENGLKHSLTFNK
jgi:hypothetical protein